MELDPRLLIALGEVFLNLSAGWFGAAVIIPGTFPRGQRPAGRLASGRSKHFFCSYRPGIWLPVAYTRSVKENRDIWAEANFRAGMLFAVAVITLAIVSWRFSNNPNFTSA